MIAILIVLASAAVLTGIIKASLYFFDLEEKKFEERHAIDQAEE